MPHRFLFMRHAESTANVTGICVGGQSLHPLTDAGREQAKAAAEILRRNRLAPGRIVHSGQPRAAETAELVGNALTIAPDRISSDTSWREREFGEWEERLFADIYPHLEAWIDPPDGETLPVLFDRITSGLKALPGGLTLIVSHGGIWHILNKQHGISPAPHIDNAEIFEVTLDEDASPSILSERVL